MEKELNEMWDDSFEKKGKLTELENELREIVEGSTGCGSRCKWGWKIERDPIVKATLDQMKGAGSRSKKAAFRKSYCDQKWKVLKQRRTKTETWRKVDVKKGRYLTLTQIIVEEGGVDSKEANESAFNYYKMCLKLGEPWVKMNTFKKKLTVFTSH